jgi:hypothetical protein|tara:strand:+ start:1610 stop:3214 length:1605 start_codon:yes stop_codon:yes gene_type:complete
MSQPFALSCRGGLNVNLNQLEIMAQPGLATELLNFEVDPDGGYRRINGFTQFGGGSTAKPNSANTILGLFVYGDGLIVCSGTGIFFSQDGTSWLTLNKASVAGGGDDHTAFTGRSVDARTSQQQCTFALFEGTSDYGEVLICDGANKPFFFKMTGTGILSSRTFFAGEITVSGTTAPKVGVMHENHFVVGGASTAKNTIYYSSSIDPDSFSGSGAGSIALTDAVVGLASFRSDLIIFCQNSIFKLSNISDSDNIAIIPITRNVGCIAGQSIQEIGGDLLFLSPDGIRTIAGTARIGDVELSSVSRQIQKITSVIASNVNSLIISSGILRSKSQYRLFYTNVSQSSAVSKGIIGTLTPNGFEWSETKGIQANGFASGLDKDGVEQLYHGDNVGFIYNHDTGNVFNPAGSASNVEAVYYTPDLDFGDLGTRKTIKYIKVSVTPEGTVQPELDVKYDFESADTPQPTTYTLDRIPLPALFGSAEFADAEFGAAENPLIRQAVEGTGNTCALRIKSDDQLSPYSINGFYIDYMPSGRK